jgi:thiol-disulfide isomerase/thioredoxin
MNGVLAGQVLDSFNHRPPPTYIQVTDLQTGGQQRGAPIEVATDSQGYFTIQGLQPGHHYELTARSREGTRLLSGTALAIPPNPKLLIHISEDFATGATPPLPPTTTWPGSRPTASIQPPVPENPSSAGERPPQADPTWVPGRDTSRDADPGSVAPAVSPAPPAVTRPENVAQDPQADRRKDRTLVTPSWVPRNPAPAGPPAPAPQPEAAPPAGSARVPSCVLTGQTLYNFALYDLNGQPWEYLRDRRGRLVLLDFWETTCVPCVQAMSHLKGWHQRYGPYGLEVIGIAYEEGTPQEQVVKVNRVRIAKQINYRLLMGSDFDTCPVRSQFGVRRFPTLVLLDGNGRIIWRSEGLSKDQALELETLIRQHLNQ